MTVSEIIKEIDNLPNYLYEYCDDVGVHRLILGGHSSNKKEEYTNLSACVRYFKEMQELYKKETLSRDEKIALAKYMKRIMRQCDYRHSGLYTIKAQEEYLSKLQLESLEEISEQVEMYKTARKYHAEFLA